jgi:polysaccharide export outer membrane protein
MLNLSKGFVALFLMAFGLAAQTKESLLIGPGDVVHVQLFDAPEFEQHARITDTGEFLLSVGGKVKVAGLTPAQAANVIDDALLRGGYLLKPRATLTVEEYSTQDVSVLGEVHVPGAHAIRTPRSILEVLTLAGGLTDLADRKVMIQRRNTSERFSYFVSNTPETAIDTAVTVNPGDTIIVPKAGIVYVLGDVARPGGYTMTNNEGKISVLELIARAGGTHPTAVPSHSKLMRKSGSGYVEMALHLSDMQKGKRPDEPLQADDVIYVPFSYLRSFAMNGSSVAAQVGSAAVYRF